MGSIGHTKLESTDKGLLAGLVWYREKDSYFTRVGGRELADYASCDVKTAQVHLRQLEVERWFTVAAPSVGRKAPTRDIAGLPAKLRLVLIAVEAEPVAIQSDGSEPEPVAIQSGGSQPPKQPEGVAIQSEGRCDPIPDPLRSNGHQAAAPKTPDSAVRNLEGTLEGTNTTARADAPRGEVVSLVLKHSEADQPKAKSRARTQKLKDTTDPSAHQQVVAYYCATYEAKRGAKPIFGGQEGSAVKRLLEKVEGDVVLACAIIDHAFASFRFDTMTIQVIAKDPGQWQTAPQPRNSSRGRERITQRTQDESGEVDRRIAAVRASRAGS